MHATRRLEYDKLFISCNYMYMNMYSYQAKILIYNPNTNKTLKYTFNEKIQRCDWSTISKQFN